MFTAFLNLITTEPIIIMYLLLITAFFGVLFFHITKIIILIIQKNKVRKLIDESYDLSLSK